MKFKKRKKENVFIYNDFLIYLKNNELYSNLNYNNKKYLRDMHIFVIKKIGNNSMSPKWIDNAISEFKKNKREGKASSHVSPSYWKSLGYIDENEIKERVSFEQKKRSIFSKEKWMNDGLTEEEAKEKIKNIQAGISKRWVKGKSKIKSTWDRKYWMDKGLTEEDALIEVNKRNPSSRLFYDTEEEWLEKRKRISESVTKIFKEKPEVYKNFLGHVSKEEKIFFDFINDFIKDIKHKQFLVNVRRSDRTDKNVYLVDGYLKLKEGLILIEYDGNYWHDEIYDDLKDEIILETRKDILGIIRISSDYFEKNKETIKIDIKDGIKKIKDKESNRIRLY